MWQLIIIYFFLGNDPVEIKYNFSDEYACSLAKATSHDTFATSTQGQVIVFCKEKIPNDIEIDYLD